MAARAAASGAITFGLVRVPVKFYTSASDESVSFKTITPNGNTVNQRIFDSVTGEQVDSKDCFKGYEYEKGKFVTFTHEELQSLDADPSGKGNIAVDCFVPEETIDPIYVEKTYYLKPDKGGDAAFQLISNAMSKKHLSIVGMWTSRGKEKLVQVRPYKGGLMLHVLFYSNEVRDYEDNCAKMNISPAEEQLADQLIANMTQSQFDSKKYHDQYSDRVLQAAEQKRTGNTISITAKSDAPSLGLFDALKASLADQATPAASATKTPSKAAQADDAKSKPAKPKAKPRAKKTKA